MDITETKEDEGQKFNFLYQNLSETEPYLNIEWFQNLSKDDICLLKQRESSYYLPYAYHHRLVHKACCLDKPTELIVFMLEQGFQASDIDIIEIIKNKNFDLLRYYHTKTPRYSLWNSHCFEEAIRSKRIDILRYLIEHKLVNMDFMSWHKNLSYTILKAVRACFEMSDTDARTVLFQNFPEQTKKCIDYVMNEFNGKYIFTDWLDH